MPTVLADDAIASFGSVCATAAAEIRHDAECLDEPGFWAVVMTFEGHLTAVRMREVSHRPELVSSAPGSISATPWPPWRSSLDRAAYRTGVCRIRELIRAGEVYQVNLTRVLERDIDEDTDLDELGRMLARGNPAKYAARIRIPQAGLDLVCASPELYLVRSDDRVSSGPIKGTAPAGGQMLAKDHTENVMITDLVRNDLSQVSVPGTVAVEGLCVPEDYPGSTHLVSTVAGRLRAGVRWPDILAATFPPGSVSGAPKSTALQAIRRLEPVPRGPYCGAVGYVDGDARTARLAVGIRTFWADRDDSGRRVLRFGTGAGITWGSDPEGEWCETVLKARRLVALAQVALAGEER